MLTLSSSSALPCAADNGLSVSVEVRLLTISVLFTLLSFNTLPCAADKGLVASVEVRLLIEHFAGKFPTWLAPVQVKILPISDKFVDYADEVKESLESKGVRVEVDLRTEKIGYKIREAQLQKIPYMDLQ